MNRTLYLSMIAFAAAAAVAVSANSTARAEEPGHASLIELIHEDLDREQADFALALADKTGRKINARMAESDNVFGPLVAAAPEATAETMRVTARDTDGKLAMRAMARAEFEIGKDAANIANPFNPRLPMPPSIVAFEGGES